MAWFAGRGRVSPGGIAALALIALVASARLAAADAPRVVFPESIRPVPRASEAALDGRTARVVRTALTPAETAAPMAFSLPLRMRNFAELQARVERGELIPRAEMEQKYLPLAADYDKVAAWAVAKGFTLTQPDASHLAVFLRGPVNRVAEVFQTTFGRVAADGREFTSALTAPSLPMAFAPALLGVNGLQPHLRARKFTPPQARPASLTSPNSPPYLPSELLQAYGARTTGLTGSGQTIAIVIDTYLLESDLATFWQNCGVNQSLANIQRVAVASGTSTDTAEATIDAEMTSAMAPSATIRLYTTGDLGFDVLNQAYNQVYNDLTSHPNLHQVNLSYGIVESVMAGPPYSTWRAADTQVFAALAAAGVSVIASTGDGGSNPGSSGSYSASATLQPILPASDPSVTAVGGTTLRLDTSSGAISSETGWSVANYGSVANPAYYGSGGGVSTIFTRPSWQVGTGVPSGTQRLVPDVAIDADLNTSIYIVLNGTGTGNYGGTSFSAPVWSGLTALLNQARATAGQQPLGLLGPHFYPLIGTTSFHDILSGNNGSYDAGIGYDLVTGLGSPNVAALTTALASASFAPAIVAQPPSQTVAAGQNATFSVTVTGNPAPSFHWQRRPAGTSSWSSDLTDSAPYGGTATATLTVSAVTEAMSGDSFRCSATNTLGSITSSPAALIVASPLTIATLAGSAGASGTADGTGAAARFNGPSDVAVDSAGNAYVTDTNNNTIRKITPAGVVSTLAGSAGASGSADGTGGAARFHSPTGITIDGQGNLFVADTENNTIRKITPAGTVTTFAGQAGVSGSIDGASASFNMPGGVALDGSGNLFVADSGNDTIRKITPAGVVSTLAGLAGSSGATDGTGSAARFSAPIGLTVDSAGNIFVADAANSAIRKVTPAGVVTTFAGLAGTSGTSDGVGSDARFQYPLDVAVGPGNVLYVVDTDNQTIRQIAPSGATGTVAGTVGLTGASDGRDGAARFHNPSGITADSAGHVYIVDTDNNTIRNSLVGIGPVITTQPSSLSVTVGSTAQFTVAATGTPAPTYQWQFNGVAIASATSATLTLSNVQLTDAGTYTVVVANTAGSVTSNPATLTVNASPTTTIPPSGGGGGGGGGGAPSLWFAAALVLLAVFRRAFLRRADRPPAT